MRLDLPAVAAQRDVDKVSVQLEVAQRRDDVGLKRFLWLGAVHSCCVFAL